MSHPAEGAILRIDGAVGRPSALGYDDLGAIPEASQVRDVGRYHPNRPGDAVLLEAVLALAGPLPEADYLTLHAGRDDFHVSVPLAAVRGEGLLVYRLGDGPLPPERGGPVRFLIRDPAACRTHDLDDCANIKYLDRIELTVGPGRDTRPQDEREHEALHERERQQQDAPPPGAGA